MTPTAATRFSPLPGPDVPRRFLDQDALVTAWSRISDEGRASGCSGRLLPPPAPPRFRASFFAVGFRQTRRPVGRRRAQHRAPIVRGFGPHAGTVAVLRPAVTPVARRTGMAAGIRSTRRTVTFRSSGYPPVADIAPARGPLMPTGIVPCRVSPATILIERRSVPAWVVAFVRGRFPPDSTPHCVWAFNGLPEHPRKWPPRPATRRHAGPANVFSLAATILRRPPQECFHGVNPSSWGRRGPASRSRRSIARFWPRSFRAAPRGES